MLQSRDKFKAGATTLEVIRNPQKYLENHEAFELFELEAVISTSGNGNFRFDLKYTSKSGPDILVDTKNHERLSQVFASKGSRKQLKAYLAAITDFSQLRLVQQKRGMMDLEGFKKALQAAMKKNDYEIYDFLLANNNGLLQSIGANSATQFKAIVDDSLFASKLYSIVRLTL